MLKDKSAYFLTCDVIRNLFEKTMKQIFTNEFSYKEMKFHSFFIIKNDNIIIQNAYYDDIELEDADLSKHSDAKSLIDTYLKKIFGDCPYILKESDLFQEDGLYCKIYWVFLSEYLDKNYGKLFLNCLLEQLEMTFNNCIKYPQAWVTMHHSKNIEGEVAEVIGMAEHLADVFLYKVFIPYIRYFIDSVAGEYYEKSECQSNLVFFSHKSAEKIKTDKFVYHFTDIDFVPSNSRLIRKLLQIAQDNLYLVLCESGNGKKFSVEGLCTEDELKTMNPEDGQGIEVPYVKVNIKGHMQWDLFLNDAYIISNRNGHYKISHTLFELRDYLLKYIEEYFGKNESGYYDDLAKHIIKSAEQGHGTMLVVVECIEAEKMAKEFGDKKYSYADFVPREQLDHINHLNAIDGSVLMDTQGKVHGIGTILDGLMQSEGNLARGARWNSAVKFLDKLRVNGIKKAMIFIVSEDGFADVLDIRSD